MSETPKPAQSGGSQIDAAGRSEVENAAAGSPGQGESVEERPEPGAAGEARPEKNADADEKSLSEQLEAVQAELAQQQDRYLRAAAEAENIRRRTDNDIANARKYAIEGFASEVLAVRDSLEIAHSLEIAADDAGAVAKMKEGLDLTLKQLDSALSKYAIEAVDPQPGEKLDPDRHQAMTTQESDNVPPNHILSVIQRGYMIHDRLLRPAMVVVARKPPDEPRADGDTA